MSGFIRTTLAEFLGDSIIYRSLDPLDPRLPRYAELAPRVGLSSEVAPRKCQPEYARSVAGLLRAAAKLRNSAGVVERILLVGDTQGNDATAFKQLCRDSGWPGIAFIGRDDLSESAAWNVCEEGDRTLVFASRWRLLDDLDAFCRSRRFPIDERTAVIVDIDKTAIGARGRNDAAIDRARIDAVQRTLDQLLGKAPAWEACRRLYDSVNRAELQPLTGDNQDVVAFLCLAIEGGLIPLELPAADGAGSSNDLSKLLDGADGQSSHLPPKALVVYRRFRDGVRRGSPPEWAVFRENEYAATVRRMDLLPDNAPREQRMAEEITITAEVRAAALRWREGGALLIGLSDKPDAASLPTAEMAAAGHLPLHRTEARVVGEG